MTWLLTLYPPRWRRRYGREFTEIIAAQPFSIGTAVDVMAGAIDAWISPQLSTQDRATPDPEGGTAMVAKLMRLKCAGYGPPITTTDAWKGAGVTLGGTVMMVMLAWSVRPRFAGNPYFVSLLQMAFFVPMLLGLRHTSLKGRSATVQAVFIVGLTGALAAIFVAAAWMGTRL